MAADVSAGGAGTDGRLRIGVYDLYWSTLGGGEQVDGSIAQVLAAGHDVTLLGPRPIDVDATRRRLGVDLAGCGYRRVDDDAEASTASADYELFVNGTYLSKAVNRAPLGYYYVHFPGEIRTRLDELRSRAGVVGVKVMSLPPRLPQRLTEVRAAFDRRVERVEFLPTYTRYLANSEFTARWVERLWDAPADVLYPPVRPSVVPGDKQPLILVLGRFSIRRSDTARNSMSSSPRSPNFIGPAGSPDGAWRSWEVATPPTGSTHFR